MSIRIVVRGGVWNFLGTSVSNIIAYLYWVYATMLFLPESLGPVSAILAVHGIAEIVFAIGIPAGLQRYIGRSYGEGDYDSISSYFCSGVVLLVALNVPFISAILLLSLSGYGLLGLTNVEFLYVGTLLLSSFLTSQFNALFISLLKTSVSARALVAGAIFKMAVGMLVVQQSRDPLSVIVGFIVSYIIADIVFLGHAVRLYRSHTMGFQYSSLHSKELVIAGSAAWAPRVLTVLGDNLGTLILFRVVGGSQTSFYFLALTISLIVYSLPKSILAVMYPYLSSTGHGREPAMDRAIRITMAITVPIALVLICYSYVPIAFLGAGYAQTAQILSVVSIGAVVSPVVYGYFSYTYAIGRYRQVAFLEMATNLSRILLYVPLVVLFSDFGAAVAYSCGMMFGVIYVSLSSSRLGFRLNWSHHAKAVFTPLVFVVLVLAIDIFWVIEVLLLLLGISIAYGRLEVLTRTDVKDLAESLLPSSVIAKLYRPAKPLLRVIFGRR